MLDDVLAHDLHAVFCGRAVGDASLRRRAYYAGPGNKFWRTLHRTGLTPRQLAPAEYRSLPQYGYGLTDIVKGQSGNDADIVFAPSDASALREKIRAFAPRILAFNGKRAAMEFLGRRRVEYGLQGETVGSTRIFVAPSTSGAANGFWDEGLWFELARLIEETSG